MKKSDRKIMEILEAFDSTGSAHSAAELAGVDPKTVRRYVQEPEITLVKTGEFDGGEGGILGGTAQYTFAVTNTGTVTLTGVAISDELPGLSKIAYGDWLATAGTLAPGESVTATASLTLTQEHIDAGSILNTATVTGTPPGDGGDDGEVEDVTDTDEVTLKVTPTPAISLEKTGSLVADATGALGDGVQFVFVATNTGNVTLYGVTIEDPLPGLSDLTYGAWPGKDGVLKPGESITATADYALTKADVAAGVVKNTATVKGSTGAGHGAAVTVESLDSVTIDLPEVPADPTDKKDPDDPTDKKDPSDPLAKTGSNILPLLAVVMALILIGGGFLFVALRGRRNE